VLRDLHAIVQAGSTLDAPIPSDGLLVSTLASASPFLMLNVSMGDRAVLEERACGCPFEQPGLTTHLRSWRA
jgi:hypothetical protein